MPTSNEMKMLSSNEALEELKLCLATATHEFKWVETGYIYLT